VAVVVAVAWAVARERTVVVAVVVLIARCISFLENPTSIEHTICNTRNTLF
jgi:hypothetical protein